jgi:hypothetical protein
MLQQTKTNKNDLDIFQPQIQHFKFKNEKKLFVVAGIKRHKRHKSWQNNKSKQHH